MATIRRPGDAEERQMKEGKWYTCWDGMSVGIDSKQQVTEYRRIILQNKGRKKIEITQVRVMPQGLVY